MLSLYQIKQLSQSFVKEACHFLNISADSLRIIFTSYIIPPKNKEPQISTVLQDDTIVIGEDFLRSSNSFTQLRIDLYARIRYISQRRQAKGKLDWHGDAICDAINFATALCFLKELQLPCNPSLQPKKKFEGALQILANEYNLHGKIFKMPTNPYKGNYFYKLRLEETDRKKIEKKYTRSVPYTGVEPLSGEKGSSKNPFNNINDAVEFLRKMEHVAYTNDSLINDIANMDYFYDTNSEHFRVMWASPYVAHLKHSFPEKSFFISKMAPLDFTHPEHFYFCLKPNLYKHKFLYRGQSSYYPGKPCKPNLFRDKKHNDAGDYLDFLIYSQELELLIRSHPIVQLLENGIELLHDTFRIRMHYSGLAQHYYNKSHFLDFSSDLEVVKFFATTDYKSETDEYVPFVKENEIGVIYYYELKFPEAFQQHEHYALKTIGKQIFSRSGLQSGFLLEMDKEADLKENVDEIKKIFFRHNARISKDLFVKSNNGKNYFPDDILMHAWHDRMKKRFKDKVVSRKAVLYNVSINSSETENSITKKLKDKGITVDDYDPSFTVEELDFFYKNIEQWWNDFCSDIYFADAENDLYREAMKNIIHEDRYSWAFQRDTH